MEETMWVLVESKHAAQVLQRLSRAGLCVRATSETGHAAPPLPRRMTSRCWIELALPEGVAAGQEHLACGDIVLDVSSRRVTVRGRPVALSPTEFQLLRTFLENPGCALSRERLAQGLGREVPDRALDGHVKNLRRKIERNPGRPRTLLTVYGMGYRLACGQKPT